MIAQVVVLPSYGQTSSDLLSMSEQAMDRRDWVAAINNYEQLVAGGQSSSALDKQQYSQVLLNLGVAYLNQAEYQKSEAALLESLTLKKQIGDSRSETYGKVLQQLGFLYLRTGNFDQAKDYIVEAVELVTREKGRNSYEYAVAISELGEFYEKVGYYTEAFEKFAQAHDIIELLHDENTPEYANICNHMGRILIKNGLLKDAEGYLLAAASTYEKLGDDYVLDYTASLESLGVLYETEGKFAESERVLLKNLDIKRGIDGLPEEVMIETLNDLGILYQHLGNVEKSEMYFKEVHDICIESLGTDHGYYGIATNNLGTIAKKKGQFEKAEELLLESIRVYETTYGKNHPLYADALNNLASVETSLKKYDKADVRYQQVLMIDREIYGTQHPLYATTLSNYGIMLFKKGEVDKAEEMYAEALKIREAVLGTNHPSYANSMENLGLYYFIDGKMEEAEKYLSGAIDILRLQINSLFPVMTENEREVFYETIRNDIERYNFVALQMIDDKPELIEKMLNNQIQTKAILMNSSEKAKRKISQSKDSEVINLYNEWVRQKDQLVRFYQLGKNRLEENQINLNEIEQAVESLEKQLMQKSSQFQDILPENNYTWKDVQQVLKPGEAVVEVIKVRKFNTNIEVDETGFGFQENCYYVAIIFDSESESPKLVTLEEGLNLETIHYPFYSNALEYELEDTDSFKFFWKPIDKELKNIENVYVSPDGIFHKVNPNIFRTSSRSYLIDEYYVSYITNCTDLLREKDQQSALSRAYLVGNPDFNLKTVETIVQPLPGAQKEIVDIARYVHEQTTWDTRILVGKEANEGNVRNFFEPTILHIATHGFFMDNDRLAGKMIPGDISPLFQSGLYLAGVEDAYQNFQRGYRNDPSNDGMLTAYEAMNMDLEKTDLVVLSACETGLGLIGNGEGVYGLQRAFIVAGAQNVIISYVKVDDEATEKMMDKFYERYTMTRNVKSALREAQLALREEYDNPYIWGAFMLIGKG